MVSSNKITTAIALSLSLSLVLFLAVFSSSPVRSQSTTPTPIPTEPTPTPTPTYLLRTHITRFGMQFVDGGRIGRLTLENPLFRPGEIVPCIRAGIVIDYYEAAGDGSVRLAFVRRVMRSIELEGGEAANFDFPVARGGSFVSVSVRATPEELDPYDPRSEFLTSTLSIRESGNTILTLPAVQRGFDPQPDPPSPNVPY